MVQIGAPHYLCLSFATGKLGDFRSLAKSKRAARAKKRTGKVSREAQTNSSENVDQIRDILFGGQIREFEDRFVRLEELILKSASELEKRTSQRLDALEAGVDRQIERMTERMKAELGARSEIQKELARDLKDVAKSFQKQLKELREQLKTADDDLRDQLAAQLRAVRAEKTDRATLGALLAEVAMRLTDDHPPAG